MKKTAILVVDDEASSRYALKACLETREEFYVDVASTGYDALRHLGAPYRMRYCSRRRCPDVSAGELCR